MGLTIEALAWDSDYFGFPIGRVDLEHATRESLQDLAHAAREAGIACLYGHHDSSLVGKSVTIQAAGWRLVDVTTTFILPVSEPAIPRPPETVFRPGTPADTESVIGIAEQMAAWSRFAADPNFGIEQARRLQRSWLERALGPSETHSLMVAEQESGIVAIIGRVASPQPRVDAVGTTKRGSGAARYLIQGSREWAEPLPLLGGPIAARNIAALRYVSHCGYRANTVEHLYHYWIEKNIP